MKRVLSITLFLLLFLGQAIGSNFDGNVIDEGISTSTSGLSIAPFTIDYDFDGKIEILGNSGEGKSKEKTLQWAVRKLDRWGEPSTIHQSSIELFDTNSGNNREMYLDLPDRWDRGDYLELTFVNSQGEELSKWTYPFMMPKEMNDKVLGLYRRIARQPLELVKNQGELVLIAGSRRFVFDMRANYLREIWIDESMIPFAQASYSIEGIESLKGRNYYDWNSNGSVTVTFEFEPADSKISWTVFADGRLRLDGDIFVLENQVMNSLGLGFDLNESKLEEVKWIGNGPQGQQEAVDAKFGIWKNQFIDKSSPTFPLNGGVTSQIDLYALLLSFENSSVIIRSDSEGLFFELQSPIWTKVNSSLPNRSTSKSNLCLFLNQSELFSDYLGNIETSPSGERASNSSVRKIGKDLTLWFDFK